MPSFPLRHTRPCPLPVPAPLIGVDECRGDVEAAPGPARLQALMAADLTGQPTQCRGPTGAERVGCGAGYFPLGAA